MEFLYDLDLGFCFVLFWFGFEFGLGVLLFCWLVGFLGFWVFVFVFFSMNPDILYFEKLQLPQNSRPPSIRNVLNFFFFLAKSEIRFYTLPEM